MIQKLLRWLRHRTLYVIADARDNSITLSRALASRMRVFDVEVPKVFVFRVDNDYAFTVNPHIEQPTQLADIQYNSKHRCIGFESLTPTVNRIFYDYGLPANSRCRLSVEPCTDTPGNLSFFKICRPQ